MIDFKIKKRDILRCIKTIPDESFIKVDTLYTIAFFLHKETKKHTWIINWKDRHNYWVYTIGENGKTWKQNFSYFNINIKLLRKYKLLQILQK